MMPRTGHRRSPAPAPAGGARCHPGARRYSSCHCLGRTRARLGLAPPGSTGTRTRLALGGFSVRWRPGPAAADPAGTPPGPPGSAPAAPGPQLTHCDRQAFWGSPWALRDRCVGVSYGLACVLTSTTGRKKRRRRRPPGSGPLIAA